MLINSSYNSRKRSLNNDDNSLSSSSRIGICFFSLIKKVTQPKTFNPGILFPNENERPKTCKTDHWGCINCTKYETCLDGTELEEKCTIVFLECHFIDDASNTWEESLEMCKPTCGSAGHDEKSDGGSGSKGGDTGDSGDTGITQ